MGNFKKPFIIYALGLFFLLLVHMVGPLHAQGDDSAKEVVGWVEYACIKEIGVAMAAKLDSGADHSSLNVGEAFEFQRDGSRSIRFAVVDGNGQKRILEAHIMRTARIKRHTSIPDHRPVILLDICLGKTCRKAEVNLVDRSNYTYPLLLGRSFLTDHFLIDPSRKFILIPNCR